MGDSDTFEHARLTMKQALHAFNEERRKLEDFLASHNNQSGCRTPDDASIIYELQHLQESEEALRKELEGIHWDDESTLCSLTLSSRPSSSMSLSDCTRGGKSSPIQSARARSPIREKSSQLRPRMSSPSRPHLVPASPFTSPGSKCSQESYLDDDDDDDEMLEHQVSSEAYETLRQELENAISNFHKESDGNESFVDLEKGQDEKEDQTSKTGSSKRLAILLFGSKLVAKSPVSVQVFVSLLLSFGIFVRQVIWKRELQAQSLVAILLPLVAAMREKLRSLRNKKK